MYAPKGWGRTRGLAAGMKHRCVPYRKVATRHGCLAYTKDVECRGRPVPREIQLGHFPPTTRRSRTSDGARARCALARGIGPQQPGDRGRASPRQSNRQGACVGDPSEAGRAEPDTGCPHLVEHAAERLKRSWSSVLVALLALRFAVLLVPLVPLLVMALRFAMPVPGSSPSCSSAARETEWSTEGEWGSVGGREGETVTTGAFDAEEVRLPSSTRAAPPPMMKATNPAMVMTSQVVRDTSYPLVGYLPPLGRDMRPPRSQCLSERDRLALDQASGHTGSDMRSASPTEERVRIPISRCLAART